MFWNNLVLLCNKRNISPNTVALSLGLSNATATKWKQGAIPRNTTLKKIADYFNITVDELLEGSQEKEKGTLLSAPKNNISDLTAREIDIIMAYRRQEKSVQAAIDRMLELPPESEHGTKSNLA